MIPPPSSWCLHQKLQNIDCSEGSYGALVWSNFLFREGTQLNCEIKLRNLTNCCEIVELSYRHLPAPLHCCFVSWNILEKREGTWRELPLAKHCGSSNVWRASMSQISDPVHSKRAGSSQKFLRLRVPLLKSHRPIRSSALLFSHWICSIYILLSANTAWMHLEVVLP